MKPCCASSATLRAHLLKIGDAMVRISGLDEIMEEVWDGPYERDRDIRRIAGED